MPLRYLKYVQLPQKKGKKSQTYLKIAVIFKVTKKTFPYKISLIHINYLNINLEKYK